ncbi:MAG: hypothetical protein NTY68_02290 [Candidatus Micrarchaeota archaeon]|nr:hypothetical protein [Candidatus Micrarchaeota archaeon]
MAQKLKKLTESKAAEGIKAKKLRFDKLDMERVQLDPDRQDELNNRLADALVKGKKQREIKRLLKAGADMKAITLRYIR